MTSSNRKLIVQFLRYVITKQFYIIHSKWKKALKTHFCDNLNYIPQLEVFLLIKHKKERKKAKKKADELPVNLLIQNIIRIIKNLS